MKTIFMQSSYNFNVSIVIPNWNGRKLLEKNIPIWLAAKAYPKNKITEIVIVDDKSTDDSLVFIKKNYSSEIKVVSHKKNRGFSAAVNTGFRSAKNELICLLNTDVLPQKDFLQAVIKSFNDPKVFGISLHEKGYGYGIGKFRDGYIVHDPGKEKKETTHTFWVSGGSGVFRRNIWMKLGGLDEAILPPFYWEDVDLSYRALKRGYKLLWEPKAKVVHEHESVINKSNFRQFKITLIKERNHLLLNWKNLTSSNLLRKHRAGMWKRLRRNPGYIKVIFAALLKIRAVRKARRKEMKEATVSDEAIFASFEK